MGIAQRLTVVKQHDTEPARDHLLGWSAPNSRSHGLPDAPQALRWGGVPAAKHPRKIAHHGPEPKSCTPFPTNGQVFSMRSSGRICARGRAPSPLSWQSADIPCCCSMVDARATRTSRARGTLATPAEGGWRGAGSAGDAPNCEHQDFAARQPAAAKHVYMYDVPAVARHLPCPTPPSSRTALGMIRAATHDTHPDTGNVRRVATLAPAARPPLPATQKPSTAQSARAVAPPLVILSQPKRHALVTTQGAGCAEGARPLTGTDPKHNPFVFNP